MRGNRKKKRQGKEKRKERIERIGGKVERITDGMREGKIETF